MLLLRLGNKVRLAQVFDQFLSGNAVVNLDSSKVGPTLLDFGKLRSIRLLVRALIPGLGELVLQLSL
jgi:hypothetical protein